MVTFQINDMTCGHCASTITKAITAVDKSARVEVDIPRKLVRVSGEARTAVVAGAIQEAGYTPEEVKAEPATPAAPRASRGCGCGCGPKKAPAVAIGQGAAAVGGSCCG
jgi:copper chaperone